MPAQHLYLIEAVGSGYAKVGSAANPRQRLHDFKGLTPFALRYRRVVSFGRVMDAFAAERRILDGATRLRGEWVTLNGDLDALFAHEARHGEDVTAAFLAPVKQRGKRLMPLPPTPDLSAGLMARIAADALRLHPEAMVTLYGSGGRPTVAFTLPQGEAASLPVVTLVAE